jgi:hypothetical protein
MRLKALFLVVICLAGCLGPISRPDSDTLAKTSCASASAALKVLTVARQNNKLSAEQIEQVNAAKAKTDLVCKTAPYPTLSDIELRAVAELVSLASKLGQ